MQGMWGAECGSYSRLWQDDCSTERERQPCTWETGPSTLQQEDRGSSNTHRMQDLESNIKVVEAQQVVASRLLHVRRALAKHKWPYRGLVKGR
jgi:hypothetical protein